MHDSLDYIGEFQFATVIDFSMDYYAMMLDEYSHNLCTIVLPWVDTNIEV